MSVPAYRRVKDFVLAHIQRGEWREGDRVPSEHDLTRRFGLSRMTVNRALRELTAEQVLVRARGAGTFVAPPKLESTLVEIKSIAAEIAARGHRHSSDVLVLERRAVPQAIASELELPGKSAAFHSTIIHQEEGAPIQLEDRWVNPAAAPGYLDQDFGKLTPSEYLMQAAPLARVEYRIEARAPDALVRRSLEMGGGEPCLLLHRRTWSRGRVASVADLWYPGGRYLFTGAF